MELATKQEQQEMLDQRFNKLKDRLIEEIRMVGKTEYIGLQEVANELGYSRNQSASEWLRRNGENIQVLWDHKPIRVNRDDFYNYLRSQ